MAPAHAKGLTPARLNNQLKDQVTIQLKDQPKVQGFSKDHEHRRSFPKILPKPPMRRPGRDSP